MIPCKISFPVSIGDRVFSPRLRKAGTVIGLSICEQSGPKAQIEFLNNANEPKSTWLFCNQLQEPTAPHERTGIPSMPSHTPDLSGLSQEERINQAKRELAKSEAKLAAMREDARLKKDPAA